MADFSFTVEYSLDRPASPRHGHHTTPAASGSFTPIGTSPYIRRRRSRPLHEDRSSTWQDDVSWQVEPTGWGEATGLAAALSPWASTPARSPIRTSPACSIRRASPARLSRRTAQDYYTSNPLYEMSREASSAFGGRLELQSHVVNGPDRGDASMGISSMFPNFGVGRVRDQTAPDFSLASKDELSTVEYGSPYFVKLQPASAHDNHHHQHHHQQHDRHHHHAYASDSVMGHAAHVQFAKDLHHQDDDASFSHDQHSLDQHNMLHHASFSHFGHKQLHMEHDTSFSDNLHSHHVRPQHNDHDYMSSTYGQRVHHHNADSNNYDFDDDDENEDEQEDEEIVGKPVSLFSLFKYSSKLDLVLVFLGCIGALINGGSLPWYSYLFGNFVNKLAQEAVTDKSKMMKDVQQVFLSTYFI